MELNEIEIKAILSETLDPAVVDGIAQKMVEAWKKIEDKWGNHSLDGLAEHDYKAKIKDMSDCFSIYLSGADVKKNTIELIYNKLFGDVPESNSPFLVIAAGAIASGKSTVIKCVLPEKYGKYGEVDKDKIKASNIFHTYIHEKLGDEHGNMIEDFMLALRDDIGKMAINAKKSILLEQSCKTDGFLDTCKLAKEAGFKVHAEVVITPIAFTILRNVYRYVTGLIEDEKTKKKTARYEAFVNIKDTYDNAPLVLAELWESYADDITVYTSDILKIDTNGKTMAQIFGEATEGPISDISFEIAGRMYDYVMKNIDYVKNNQDIMKSLKITKKKLAKLSADPRLSYCAMPQKWQPKGVRDELDRLNGPLGFVYSKRLDDNDSRRYKIENI